MTTPLIPHPAIFPEPILERLRALVPKGRVLDPFGGVGRLGLLGPEWEVVSVDIEPEWAEQGIANGCVEVHVENACRLPFGDDSFPTVCTSPAYGNRFADNFKPTPGLKSNTSRRFYRGYLGRELHAFNGGGMQWGDDYRQLHALALREIARVLEPGGTFVLNIKDHVRDGKRQSVPAWWGEAAEAVGLRYQRGVAVPTRGDQNTARHRKQGKDTVDAELILLFELPGAPELPPAGQLSLGLS